LKKEIRVPNMARTFGDDYGRSAKLVERVDRGCDQHGIGIDGGRW
jgi:hypothetical protein